jgi:hypothetical protein
VLQHRPASPPKTIPRPEEENAMPASKPAIALTARPVKVKPGDVVREAADGTTRVIRRGGRPLGQPIHPRRRAALAQADADQRRKPWLNPANW